MIIDRLSNADLYRNVHPGLGAAFDWLRTTDLASLPLGTTAIDGETMYAIVVEQMPRDRSDSVHEAHREYWDVQCVAKGEERMGWVSLAEAIESVPYEVERDVTFYEDKATSFVRVPAGCFAIFGPEDVHMPGVAPEGHPTGLVRKIVVKVRVAH